MSTNYYFKFHNTQGEGIHLGKTFSGGGNRVGVILNTKIIPDASTMIDFVMVMSRNGMGEVFDEYGNSITSDQFKSIILSADRDVAESEIALQAHWNNGFGERMDEVHSVVLVNQDFC